MSFGPGGHPTAAGSGQGSSLCIVGSESRVHGFVAYDLGIRTRLEAGLGPWLGSFLARQHGNRGVRANAEGPLSEDRAAG